MTPPPSVKEVSSGYGEMALVEKPAIDEFLALGWQTVNLFSEVFGPPEDAASTEGRRSEHEVVLPRRLRAALELLNPGLPAAAYDQAMEALSADRSKMLPVAANQQVHAMLRERVKVQAPDEEGRLQHYDLSVIDWSDPDANDYFLGQQVWVSGDMYRRRCDLVGFVNGLPLVFVELKAPHVPLKAAFDENTKDYKGQSIPQLFHYNGFILLSNGLESKAGTLSASWEHYGEWKRVADEEEPGDTSLATAIRGLCQPARLLDLIENFTVFEQTEGGTVKKMARNHQVLGVNRALAKLLELRQGGDPETARRLGVVWHTQGSGKSLSMVFFTAKVLRRVGGKYTFVVVTDREELDDQISRTFANTGATSAKAENRATSAEHLRRLLAADHRYVFTTLQKFRVAPGQRQPIVSERSNVIVITDEAHRSQYDIFALNMRQALPNASFLGFTGTPLIHGEEERTREVFGDYVSVYDFARSIEDGATVPLYYENRIPELELKNDQLNADMERLLEDAELDEAQQTKLEREFAREYHLLTRIDRLDTVARDLVRHFVNRGYRGKAMVVSIDKAAAVRMHDLVRKHWAEYVSELEALARTTNGDALDSVSARLAFMSETDMAVVVSQGQNEVEELTAKGLDIKPHRQRMVKEDLAAKFKDGDDKLRLAFVCAMWITGFDVPTCSTLYLDKPMKQHTLMQTIARANRVAEGKQAGLIVDYVGVLRSLQKALAVYALPGKRGELPIREKAALVARLAALIGEATYYVSHRGADLEAIAQATGGQRLALLASAREALIASEQDRKGYLLLAGEVAKTFQAILPDPAASEHAPMAVLIAYIAATIKALDPPADISGVMGEIETLLNDSISAEGYLIGAAATAPKLVNLSEIDFEQLRAKFAATPNKHTEAQRLIGQVQQQVAKMVEQNRSRMDFLKKFEAMIAVYNAGSANVEAFFAELVEFAKGLTREQQRAMREGLDEEELAIFDILTRPAPEMTEKERGEVKQLARELLSTLKQAKLVLDWRAKPQSRAEVEVAIRDAYGRLPKAYTPDLRKLKRTLTFAHLYDHYYGAGASAYGARRSGG